MPKTNYPRLYSFVLVILALICLAAYYQMAWVNPPGRANEAFGESFGSGERTGWALLEWTEDVESVARVPLRLIWFIVPIITLLAFMSLVLANSYRATSRWVRRSQVFGAALSFAVVIAIVGIMLLSENPEALQAGYWVAGFCAVCLTEGFAIQVREFDSGTGAPVVPPGNAALIVHSGSAEGTRVPISASPFTIGRQEQNLLVLPDDLTVSRQHAIILYHSGEYFLRAVSPTQPFWVGKTTDSLRQELSWRLQPNDFFTIGESLIEFNVETGS